MEKAIVLLIKVMNPEWRFLNRSPIYYILSPILTINQFLFLSSQRYKKIIKATTATWINRLLIFWLMFF